MNADIAARSLAQERARRRRAWWRWFAVRSATPLHAAVWVCAGLLLTGAGWLLTARAVPIYDGIGFPDEPYRYVAPPLSARTTLPPGQARGVLATSKGLNVGAEVVSGEIGPQVGLYLLDGVLSAPAPATVITVTAAPHAAGAAAGDAAIIGNVYTVTVGCDAGPVTFTGRGLAYVTLRAPPQANGTPVVVYRADPTSSWSVLSTDQIGQDMFRAPLTHPGDYALLPASPGPAGIETGPAATTGGPDRSSDGTASTQLVLLLVAAVAVMALALLGLRIRTIRTQDSHQR